MKKVAVIGLGWIGLPLANFLQDRNWEVCGSTTSKAKCASLQEAGISAIQFQLDPFPKGEGFQKLFEAEYMVINIPPKSRSQSSGFYIEQLKYLMSMLGKSEVKKVVFVSSTGVYPSEKNGMTYTEDFVLTKENAGNPTLLTAEKMVLSENNFDTTIIRFGGLLGVDRIPGRYFSGKDQVVGHTRVNFIHQEDAVRVMAWILEEELWGKTFNAVAPVHAVRKEIYEKNSHELGIKPPKSYAPPKEGEDRLISPEKLLSTGFEFHFPDPLDFTYVK
ncbi:NAD(P)-binding domain-containing protein [Algoriphagus machipongonensis]|uniref:6-phosphogluconate dehydrogenase NADP-binding domain-containing protein n=1 Tax=Algoriphagus machipongonensis TaxID=388413 RepID=A3HXS1_9BACT|nr:NAD(P)-binding domain-containing protein [Algoriphagus machipongonensis]EAZ81394.2 putative protein YeeZ [Algoriphagus machipongonensis]